MKERYLDIPTRFISGVGCIEEIGNITKEFGKKAFIVTGRNSTKRTGLLDKVTRLLQQYEVAYYIFDKIESNPLTTTVEEGVKLLKINNCDVVIGLGGGSPMDSAKAIAFSAVNHGDITDYIFGKPGTGALPIIAVTTTAGTGSEGDCLAVLTNPDTNDKKSLKSPLVYPKVSIVDPELMTTLPKRIIASTGFDAMSHSIEAFLAKRCTPDVEVLALEAIELLYKYLPRVYENPNDVSSWEKVAYANTIGGMVIDQAGVTLPHGMEHPISGLLNVTHGEGLAALFPVILKATVGKCNDKILKIGKAMGLDFNNLSKAHAEILCVFEIKKFLEKLQLNFTLTDLGVKEDHIPWLAHNAMKTMVYAITNHPMVLNEDEIADLYRECL